MGKPVACCRRGQTIAEYVLIACLVAITGLGVLTFFVSDLAVTLPGLLDKIFGSNGSASAPGGGGGNSGAGGGNAGGNTGITTPPVTTASATSWANNQTICLPSACISIPVVAQGDLETSGGLGGSNLTMAFANVYEQIANEMAKNPNVDPALLQKIRDLANYGHEIAQEQYHFTSAAQYECQQIGSCSITHMTNPASLLPVRDLNKDGHPDSIQDFSSLLTEVNTYIQQNPGSVPQGIDHVIALQGQQINSLADGVSWLDPDQAGNINHCVSYYNNCDSGLYNYGHILGLSQDALVVSSTNTAPIIQQNANTICASGKGGSQCTVQPGQTAQGNN